MEFSLRGLVSIYHGEIYNLLESNVINVHAYAVYTRPSSVMLFLSRPSTRLAFVMVIVKAV